MKRRSNADFAVCPTCGALPCDQTSEPFDIETRFWSVVDCDGLTGLPSDMWMALEKLVARAAAAQSTADIQREMAFDAAIELAAQAAEGFEDPARDWLRRSVWDEIKRDTAARIRRLAKQKRAASTPSLNAEIAGMGEGS